MESYEPTCQEPYTFTAKDGESVQVNADGYICMYVHGCSKTLSEIEKSFSLYITRDTSPMFCGYYNVNEGVFYLTKAGYDTYQMKSNKFLSDYDYNVYDEKLCTNKDFIETFNLRGGSYANAYAKAFCGDSKMSFELMPVRRHS
jgi:hypothetical protein